MPTNNMIIVVVAGMLFACRRSAHIFGLVALSSDLGAFEHATVVSERCRMIARSLARLAYTNLASTVLASVFTRHSAQRSIE